MKKTASKTTKPTVVLRKKKQETQSEKSLRLCQYLEEIREEGLTGYIKVNFNQGNICKVEKYEEILRD